jgi:large subunit ribosomal protein L24
MLAIQQCKPGMFYRDVGGIITKHVKPSASSPQGGIEKKEAPVHISNVMFVDSKGIAARVGRRRGDDGKLVRVSVKTKEELK